MNANDAPLKICVESIFYSRADGLPTLQEHYGFEFQEENILLMELVQTYEGLRDGECEVAEGYSTDGRITAWGFANLVDSQAFFPAYNPAPTIRQDTLDAHPELAPLLAQIGPQLDEKTMTQLNARVALGADGTPSSGDEESAEEVAKEFLAKAGLLGERPRLAVGSKGFTEQLLLGKMLV
ncbi:MAG: glycine betaine ABC transporter substrate-binding protein, partial [Ardenticatenaceae bacterium]